MNTIQGPEVVSGDYVAEQAVDATFNLYNYSVMEPSGYTPTPDQLDRVFAALANPTRRDMLLQLSQGSASVTELASHYAMSQPAVSKHLRVLEKAGLVTRRADRQQRPAQLHPTNLAAAVAWLEQFAGFWEGSLDQLDQLLLNMNNNSRNSPHE